MNRSCPSSVSSSSVAPPKVPTWQSRHYFRLSVQERLVDRGLAPLRGRALHILKACRSEPQSTTNLNLRRVGLHENFENLSVKTRHPRGEIEFLQELRLAAENIGLLMFPRTAPDCEGSASPYLPNIGSAIARLLLWEAERTTYGWALWGAQLSVNTGASATSGFSSMLEPRCMVSSLLSHLPSILLITPNILPTTYLLRTSPTMLCEPDF